MDSLTNLNRNTVAAVRTGSLSYPASGAVFARLEAAVALSCCLFLTSVLRIYQSLPISRCMLSQFVHLALFSEVFSSTFLPFSDSSLCGWIDKVPSRLSAFSSYSWSFSRHSCAGPRIVRGQLAQIWPKFRQLITLYETCQIHLYGGEDKTAKFENVTRNAGGMQVDGSHWCGGYDLNLNLGGAKSESLSGY